MSKVNEDTKINRSNEADLPSESLNGSPNATERTILTNAKLAAAEARATLVSSDDTSKTCERSGSNAWKNVQDNVLRLLTHNNRALRGNAQDWGTVVYLLFHNLSERSLALRAINLGSQAIARSFIDAVGNDFSMEKMRSSLGHYIPNFYKLTGDCDFGAEYKDGQVSPLVTALINLSMSYELHVDPMINNSFFYRFMGETERADKETEEMEKLIRDQTGMIDKLRDEYAKNSNSSMPLMSEKVQSFCENYGSQVMSLDELKREISALLESVQRLAPHTS